MLHHRANEGRVVDREWLEFRQRALREAYSEEEFSDLERERYNLDPDDDWQPLHITGEQHPETYRGEETDREERDTTTDLRDQPWSG